mmetsp:Transcript_9072/g.16984  ORF Transcript_9072/g.16984 Transcript_9072/m.16984 type:complete len:81 (-) Transcript_9072:454-696(-)
MVEVQRRAQISSLGLSMKASAWASQQQLLEVATAFRAIQTVANALSFNSWTLYTTHGAGAGGVEHILSWWAKYMWSKSQT